MRKRLENRITGFSSSSAARSPLRGPPTTAHVWGRVEDEDGRFAAARPHGPEAAVVWTAGIAIAAARRVIGGAGRPGFQTAALAFGPDFVFDVNGVVREDLIVAANLPAS